MFVTNDSLTTSTSSTTTAYSIAMTNDESALRNDDWTLRPTREAPGAIPRIRILHGSPAFVYLLMSNVKGVPPGVSCAAIELASRKASRLSLGSLGAFPEKS